MKKFNWQYWYVNKSGYLLKSNIDDEDTTMALCRIPEEGLDLHIHKTDEVFRYQIYGTKGSLLIGECQTLKDAVEQSEKSSESFFQTKKLGLLQEKVLHLKNALKYLFSFNIKNQEHPIMAVIRKMFDDISN